MIGEFRGSHRPRRRRNRPRYCECGSSVEARRSVPSHRRAGSRRRPSNCCRPGGRRDLMLGRQRHQRRHLLIAIRLEDRGALARPAPRQSVSHGAMSAGSVSAILTRSGQWRIDQLPLFVGQFDFFAGVRRQAPPSTHLLRPSRLTCRPSRHCCNRAFPRPILFWSSLWPLRPLSAATWTARSSTSAPQRVIRVGLTNISTTSASAP